MYCKNCGKEIDDNAYVCPHCGVLVKEQPQVQPSTPTNSADGMSIAAIICAVLFSIVGLILSIISLNNHKADPDDNPSKKLAKIALIVSIVLMVISVIVSIIIIADYNSIDSINDRLMDML